MQPLAGRKGVIVQMYSLEWKPPEPRLPRVLCSLPPPPFPYSPSPAGATPLSLFPFFSVAPVPSVCIQEA